MKCSAEHTPVIIGVSQVTIARGQQPGPEPLELWRQAALSAAEDAGIGASGLAEADAVFLADCMSWPYDDPVLRFSQSLGMDGATGKVGPPSGTSGQTLLNDACEHIRAGKAALTVVAGGEALATLRTYRKTGAPVPWSFPRTPGEKPEFDLEAQQHPGEAATGLLEGIGAVYGFAMRDIARRAHLGISPQTYRDQLGNLLAGMTRVAAANPDAWFPHEKTSAELTTTNASNRMVAYPYTKNMVAMIDVDISAAVIVTSEAWADAHGVGRENRIYPWTSCYAQDPAYIAVRPELWKSHAMEVAARETLLAARISIDDVDHMDLYSCFASAVNFACDALGVEDRSGERVTQTGGLPYAGGPASSYMLTSIVQMAKVLRQHPGNIGLVSGVGMLMSNHIFALYSSAPPPADLVHPDVSALQAQLDALPQIQIDDEYAGPAKIATYTVAHDRTGEATHGAAICDHPGGTRSYVRICDPELLIRAEREELVGRTVEIARGNRVGEITSIA